MRVKAIQLENIRSHVKTEIPFAPGFNCLVGGLGRGKSSVLYAIDFALFGEPLGRSYNYLLREGAETGRIGLQFVQGGKKYKIVRVLQRQDGNISQDIEKLKFFEEDQLIASEKNEAVVEQLKAITGLDKELFREVVWVRQERLKELLDMTPRQRQKKMDELFGLSDYEIAWSVLAQFLRDYKVEKDVLERDVDVVGVEKLQNDYNKAVEEFSQAQDKLEDLEKELIRAEASLKEATTQLKSLEELRKKTGELRRKEAELQTNVANAEEKRARLAKQIEEKKARVNELNDRMKLLEEQEKAHRNKLQEAELRTDQETTE
ncbi:MAG: AAA family ATPase, partial [Candidatus Bathyarchaeia archaeon]